MNTQKGHIGLRNWNPTHEAWLSWVEKNRAHGAWLAWPTASATASTPRIQNMSNPRSASRETRRPVDGRNGRFFTFKEARSPGSPDKQASTLGWPAAHRGMTEYHARFTAGKPGVRTVTEFSAALNHVGCRSSLSQRHDFLPPNNPCGPRPGFSASAPPCCSTVSGRRAPMAVAATSAQTIEDSSRRHRCREQAEHLRAPAQRVAPAPLMPPPQCSPRPQLRPSAPATEPTPSSFVAAVCREAEATLSCRGRL